MDFGPVNLSGAGVMHSGYAFQEDYFAIENEMEEPIVMPINEVAWEEVVLGQSFFSSSDGFTP